jgi:hypothetical protein
VNRRKWVVLRDLAIFQVKLALDGLKDIAFMPLSIMAAALDVFFPGPRVGHRFYAVLALGEKVDSWLNLFGAARDADAASDGLFGASRAGSNSMLGRLEAVVLGHEEPDLAADGATAGSRGGAQR